MKTLNYGIVSAASIAPRFIGAIQQTDHSKVVAIASRNLEKAQNLAASHNIHKVYDNYADLYQDPEIDVVYICNINDGHFNEIKEALVHKKHVVCEKPMVLHSYEVTDLFALARKKGCFLMETQKSVFLPVTNFVKNFMAEKQLGDLKQVDMSLSFSGRFNDDHWMYDAHQGGAWIPSANYVLEYLTYLFDQYPDNYQAMVNRHYRGAIDEASLTLRFDEILCHAFITMRVDTDNTARFYFEKGHLEIANFWKAREVTVHTNKTSETHSFPTPFEMVYEVNHIHDCIEKGLLSSPIMSEKMTFECVKLVEDVHRYL